MGEAVLAIGVIFALLSHLLIINASLDRHAQSWTNWLGGEDGYTGGAFFILASGVTLASVACTGRSRYYLASLSVASLSTLIAFGVSWWKNQNRSGFSLDFYVIAICWLWLGVLLIVIIATIVGAIGQSRRGRKKNLFLCQNCGYSLRGLTVARCPECGTAFTSELLDRVSNYTDRLDSFHRKCGL